MLRNNRKLNYADSIWTAIAKCWASYQGQKRAIYLYLNVERIKGVEYKWVISDVKGKLFEDANARRDSTLFISPAEHGIGFMSLPTLVNSNQQTITSLSCKQHKDDNLSVFNFLVASKALKVISIEKVSYHFDLGEYGFDVERIAKEKSYNKGWLINNIKHK